jgi:tetratricopeptide (TPR) repeat protein
MLGKVYFFKSGLCLLVLMIMSSSVFAEKMDLETHTVVIERLTQIIKDLDEKDASKVPSSLRLADLLSERSRLKALKEVEQNCTNCLKSKEDRLSAVSYYEYVVPRLPDDMRGHAMIQKAHLHYALGQVSATEKLYKQITKEGRKKHSSLILGQAHASLGDVYFQKSDFKTAKKEYDLALSINETPQKGLIHYRLGWCLFNLGQTSKAISKLEMILKTPRLTEIQTSEGVKQDESFKIDVCKDLASLYARTKITNKTIQNLLSLSPEGQKQQNLHYLGTEADRLGKKKESALVWVVYLDNTGKDKEALDAQIRLMKLKRDMGDSKGALQTFENVKNLWKDPGCGKKCDELQGQIKNWITSWNREEKKSLSNELTLAYITYTSIFPTDEEMILWGAGVAQQRKQYSQAFDLYRNAAEVSHKKLNVWGKISKEEKASLTKSFDGALIGEIDMAETLKNHDKRISAYNHYLKLNPKGARDFEVRYQLAQVEFEKKNYEKAAGAFRALALENTKNKRTLQVTAANMSIDSLVSLKDESSIEKWSAEYAQKFPEARKEFSLIHRKSVMNITAARINSKKADKSDLEKLKTVSLVGSTAQEKINLYKNIYSLAVRIENFPEAKKANQNLLILSELKGKDREEAQKNRIWLAELELDFKTAYRLTKDESGKMTADRALRLIWLAEMAGINPSTHEKDFLRLSKNSSLRATVIVHHIQRQVHPYKAMKPYMKELSNSPDVLGKLSLEIYSKTNNREVLVKAYDNRSVRISSAGGIIGRLLAYKELNQKMSKLAKSKLNSRSDKLLKKSLEERLKLISEMEKEGQSAIKSKDLVLQAITLNVLRVENNRLYNDITKLPVPRGLKPDQQKQYNDLLLAQAQPFKSKSEQIENKLTQFWKNSTWTEQFAKNYEDARYEYKPALKQDMQQLISHTPNPYRSRLQGALNASIKIPSEKAVANARSNIKKNPFETDYVRELKELESKRGNDVVVSHLEARLQQMKGLVP